MSEQNKALDSRLIAEVWNKGKMEVVDAIFAEDYINRTPQRELPANREGIKLMISGFRAAFPDVKMSVEDVIAAGDKIVTRWIMSGTHTGHGFGIPPTNKIVQIMGVGIHRYASGKVVESWTSSDSLGLLQQLGLVPQK
jgi:steroid delta-isomerase-like uncharacterized protein